MGTQCRQSEFLHRSACLASGHTSSNLFKNIPFFLVASENMSCTYALNLLWSGILEYEAPLQGREEFRFQIFHFVEMKRQFLMTDRV